MYVCVYVCICMYVCIKVSRFFEPLICLVDWLVFGGFMFSFLFIVYLFVCLVVVGCC